MFEHDFPESSEFFKLVSSSRVSFTSVMSSFSLLSLLRSVTSSASLLILVLTDFISPLARSLLY